jgi:hypothetical protein
LYEAEFLLFHTNIAGFISSHKVIPVAEPETGHNYMTKAEYSGRNKDWSYEGKEKADFTKAHASK